LLFVVDVSRSAVEEGAAGRCESGRLLAADLISDVMRKLQPVPGTDKVAVAAAAFSNVGSVIFDFSSRAVHGDEVHDMLLQANR
jgi:hypothetical protein